MMMPYEDVRMEYLNKIRRFSNKLELSKPIKDDIVPFYTQRRICQYTGIEARNLTFNTTFNIMIALREDTR